MGWIENSSDPANLQGWCGACEQLFLSEGDKTDKFRAFNAFAIVCDVCYGEIVAFHSQEGAGV